MASFHEPGAAVGCACTVQRAFADFNRNSLEQLQVRIGLHSGEPVEDSNDLFGATVQMAARLCQIARPATIVVTDEMRSQVADDFAFRELGQHQLKGFVDPVSLFEVDWRSAAS